MPGSGLCRENLFWQRFLASRDLNTRHSFRMSCPASKRGTVANIPPNTWKMGHSRPDDRGWVFSRPSDGLKTMPGRQTSVPE